jgi:hypothetical protein
VRTQSFTVGPRIFAGCVNVELEADVGDIRECRLCLPARENLVGVAIVVADEIVGQQLPLRHSRQNRVQPQRAREDRFIIRHAPLPQLGLHRRRRVIHQIRRETLILDACVAQLTAIHVLQALLDPPHQVLAYVEQHPDFAVATLD